MVISGQWLAERGTWSPKGSATGYGGYVRSGNHAALAAPEAHCASIHCCSRPSASIFLINALPDQVRGCGIPRVRAYPSPFSFRSPGPYLSRSAFRGGLPVIDIEYNIFVVVIGYPRVVEKAPDRPKTLMSGRGKTLWTGCSNLWAKRRFLLASQPLAELLGGLGKVPAVLYHLFRLL